MPAAATAWVANAWTAAVMFADNPNFRGACDTLQRWPRGLKLCTQYLFDYGQNLPPMAISNSKKVKKRFTLKYL